MDGHEVHLADEDTEEYFISISDPSRIILKLSQVHAVIASYQQGLCTDIDHNDIHLINISLRSFMDINRVMSEYFQTYWRLKCTYQKMTMREV